MQWAPPHLSFQCTDVALSVIAMDSSHRVAAGNDLGSLFLFDLGTSSIVTSIPQAHETNVSAVQFYDDAHLLSYDTESFLLTNLETSDRQVLAPLGSHISAIDIGLEIFAANADGIMLCSTGMDPIQLVERRGIDDFACLPDGNTIVVIEDGAPGLIDIRNPGLFQTLGYTQRFSKVRAGQTRLALTTSNALYSVEYPFMTDPVEHVQYDPAAAMKPAFYSDTIFVTDRSGYIIFVQGEYCEFIQLPNEAPSYSLAGSPHCLAIAVENDILGYTQSNTFHTVAIEYLPEEEEEFGVEQWTGQNESIDVESGECTYEKYSYTNQQVYVCLTCVAGGTPFGICEQCARICHNEHDVRPLGIRRRFRCDCGNDLCPIACQTMTAPKTATNPHNHYGHNFRLHWCSCDGFDEGAMLQCCCCSDWFHFRCVGLDGRDITSLDFYDFVCHDCIATRIPYLSTYPDGPLPSISGDSPLETVASIAVDYQPLPEGCGFRIPGGRMLPPGWESHFEGLSAYQEEFGPVHDDPNLPKSHRQREYSQAMQHLYQHIFQRAESENRSIVQASDVYEAFHSVFGQGR